MWPQYLMLISFGVSIATAMRHYGSIQVRLVSWLDLMSPFWGFWILFKGGFFAAFGLVP